MITLLEFVDVVLQGDDILVYKWHELRRRYSVVQRHHTPRMLPLIVLSMVFQFKPPELRMGKVSKEQAI